MQITVKNKHHIRDAATPCEYIGRGNVLGNPFTHLKGTKAKFIVADRQAAVEAYEGWIREKIAAGDKPIIAELTRLYHLAEAGPLDLVCFCAPQACHGDVVKRMLEDAHKRLQEPREV